MMRLLITGSNGLLGQKLVKRCLKRKIDFVAVSKGENRNPELSLNDYRNIDISDTKALERIITEFSPTHIINSAAITNVDYCELNPNECRKINVEAVEALFEISKKKNIHFQQLSTDFVFDGKKGDYSEGDQVNALSIYGQSKVGSERILIESNYTNWSIVRTIIVFGTAHNLSRSNLVLWGRQALQSGEPISIVDDQFRAPTWADDLAYGCLEILHRNETGIYHLAGPEKFSIYELVQKIAKFYGLSDAMINRTSSGELNQPAKRPPITGFNLAKAKAKLNYTPMRFEDALALLEKELLDIRE